jgi:putative transposase
LKYNDAYKIFVQENNPDYYSMNTKVSQHVMQLVEQNFKSFFAKLKKCKDGSNKIPKYLDKLNGRQIAHFSNQAFSFNTKTVPDGYIKLSGTDIVFKTKVENPTFVEVKRDSTGNYLILVGYKVEDVEFVENGNYASIDLGVNNLATLTFLDKSPIIVNGKPLKSINQFYNKELSKLQSRQDLSKDKHRRTARMNRLTSKRNNKINDYMHKASRYIVNQLVSNNVSKLVIGYNKCWKQGTNFGDASNQNFVQIPFLKFVKMLTYKCADSGIAVVLREESYTSKSSFLDHDDIPTYGNDTNFKPSGYRKYRGLYVSKDKITINADVNGSLNILRKYIKEAENTDIYDLVNLVEVCSTPLVFTIK